ncbi:hypothetical protein PCANC_26768 [Puccinia coronata f. sp. avenae]|uniref:Uncharacterized protein n=1 Tax=Puccinia coronata f. sp. avenae TaxID=200324 RepID=A0A2N5RXS3_9BASI|nr:hypothetical protein PCANC_26768 [Puccinia coronata f. sp. avenae]
MAEVHKPACAATGSLLDPTGDAHQLHVVDPHRLHLPDNFVLSAGLNVGTVISAIIIFFTLQLPQGGQLGTLNWWGNTVCLELSPSPPPLLL